MRVSAKKRLLSSFHFSKEPFFTEKRSLTSVYDLNFKYNEDIGEKIWEELEDLKPGDKMKTVQGGIALSNNTFAYHHYGDYYVVIFIDTIVGEGYFWTVIDKNFIQMMAKYIK